MNAPPAVGGYRCLVVDPPWDEDGAEADPAATAPDAIAELPVPEWAAPAAFLWLWAPCGVSRSGGEPILRTALGIIEAWGFRYYTALTWDRGAVPPAAVRGPYRVTSEHCLFAYRGKFAAPKAAMGKTKTQLTAPPPPRGGKPDVFYEHVRRFEGPRLDAFARRRRAGFDAWGMAGREDC